MPRGDQCLDLSGLLGRIRNDESGAPAYDPAVLLKIVLLAYSQGIISSRKMESACIDNVMFMAVSGESRPDHSTLAAFVSKLGDEVAKLFAQVLVLCDRQGLIGREMFAIDGVKLPSNAPKAAAGPGHPRNTQQKLFCRNQPIQGRQATAKNMHKWPYPVFMSEETMASICAAWNCEPSSLFLWREHCSSNGREKLIEAGLQVEQQC